MRVALPYVLFDLCSIVLFSGRTYVRTDTECEYNDRGLVSQNILPEVVVADSFYPILESWKSLAIITYIFVIQGHFLLTI